MFGIYYYLQFVIYSWAYQERMKILSSISLSFEDSFFIILFTLISTFFVIKPFYFIEIIDNFVILLFENIV